MLILIIMKTTKMSQVSTFSGYPGILSSIDDYYVLDTYVLKEGKIEKSERGEGEARRRRSEGVKHRGREERIINNLFKYNNKDICLF